MARPLESIRALAWARVMRGAREGNRVFLAAAVLTFGARMLRKLFAAKPAVLTEELRPGETLVITHLPGG